MHIATGMHQVYLCREVKAPNCRFHVSLLDLQGPCEQGWSLGWGLACPGQWWFPNFWSQSGRRLKAAQLLRSVWPLEQFGAGQQGKSRTVPWVWFWSGAGGSLFLGAVKCGSGDLNPSICFWKKLYFKG